MANNTGRKFGGRVKGTPNKVTASVKSSFEEAFNMLQRNDKANLLAWAERNTTEFYKLASKLIPVHAEVSGPDGEPIQFSDTEAAARLAAIIASAGKRKVEPSDSE